MHYPKTAYTTKLDVAARLAYFDVSNKRLPEFTMNKYNHFEARTILWIYGPRIVVNMPS